MIHLVALKTARKGLEGKHKQTARPTEKLFGDSQMGMFERSYEEQKSQQIQKEETITLSRRDRQKYD